jgi:hypothetical protein
MMTYLIVQLVLSKICFPAAALVWSNSFLDVVHLALVDAVADPAADAVTLAQLSTPPEL